MKRMIPFVLVAAAVGAWSPDALAIIVKHGGVGSDTIYVGCVNTGSGNRLQWCLNGVYEVLDNDCTLGTSYWFEGEEKADYMFIARGLISLDCGGDTRTWTAPTYAGYYIDLYGEAGDDHCIGGNVDTYLTGGADEDFLKDYAPEGVSSGGDNDDTVISAAVSDDDSVSGGGGNDCVDDRSGTWLSFNCGAGTLDYYYDADPGGADPDVSCEEEQNFCCEAGSCGFSFSGGEGEGEGEGGGGGGDRE